MLDISIPFTNTNCTYSSISKDDNQAKLALPTVRLSTMFQAEILEDKGQLLDNLTYGNN